MNIDDNQEALRQLDFYQKLLIEYENLEKPQANTQRFIAETNDKISYLLYYLGHYSDAIDFCKKALNFYQTLLGANSYSVIAASNNIAVLYICCSKLYEAELILNSILSILKQNNDQLSLATVLNNFALLYFLPTKEEGNKAESILRQSLEIKEKILGKEDLSVAISLNNLAELYQSQRKYTEAESLLQRSLMIREKLLHTDYSGIADILFSLAKVYQQQGKYRDALSFFERSLAIRESVSGKDHPKTKKVKAEYERFLEKQATSNK